MVNKVRSLRLNIFSVVFLGWHFSRIIRHLKLSRCNCLQKLYFCRLATLIRNDEMNVKIKITPGSCQVQDKFECLFVDEPRYEHCWRIQVRCEDWQLQTRDERKWNKKGQHTILSTTNITWVWIDYIVTSSRRWHPLVRSKVFTL